MKSLLAAAVLALSAPGALASGHHNGEADKVRAVVAFLGAAGRTTAHAGGVTYLADNFVFAEPKVYPPEFWGTYPLYFVGATLGFTVTLTNLTDRGSKPFRLRVEAVSSALETTGLSGVEIARQEWVVPELAPWESKTVSGSVFLSPEAELPSGLDVTRVRVLHLNEGGGDAALIKEERALWCPPPAR